MKTTIYNPEGPSVGPHAFTVEEAAERLRIGRTLMYDLIRRNEIHTIQLGRRRVIPASELDRLLTVQP